MLRRLLPSLLCVLLFAGGRSSFLRAEEPLTLEFSINNAQQQLRFGPVPSTEAYKVFRTESLDKPFVEDGSGTLSGFTWTAPFRFDSLGFYTVKPVPMSNNDLLSAIVLNRLAYGQTPDELERVKVIGAEAYIREQLAPEAIEENLETDRPTPIPTTTEWRFFTVTGTVGNTNLYVYLNLPGEGWFDDLSLVTGGVPNVGQNLIRNGDFEAPLTTADWTISPEHAGSARDVSVKHSGDSSLRIVASAGGSTLASSIWQAIKGLKTDNTTYTLSYWYLQSTEKLSSPTVRMSTSPNLASSPYPISRRTKLDANAAAIGDLRSWHIQHAVQSKKQLLEVLLQFFENHFVTEYNKSRDWFDGFYDGDDPRRSVNAVNLEFREIQRWRQALLNPKCTFYDLLKISAESPAMIIYLDTVRSRGNGPEIANENYARELLELFTYGVDNGYDQTDIVETSKAWAGWRVAMQKPENEFNPLAPPLFHPSNQPREAVNHTGVWSFWYRPDRHNNNAKTIFAGRTVPARFGAPYAGRNYELKLPARSGAAGMQDGYEIISHLADQPFTQEYISVKLCRLFVHDDFVHGVYDYTDPHLSPEGRLIKQCMEAWENGTPKGQIRAVLATIFGSELFRGNGAALQKVKTPLEFTVSAIRALRANVNGTFTAETDGFATFASAQNPLNRMGSMNLFDRAEPDGYPEFGPPWISAGTLAERLRWVQAFLIAPGQSGRNEAGNTYCDPVALLKAKLPQTSWQSADAVADYFVSLFYPGEGQANLDHYRKLAADFLNTAENGATPSPFASRSMSGNPSPYDTRLRGMVAMLLTLQRFQEQ
ncbi:MAG: DUF1800 family protein [Verrucomicrobiales bacterium]|nr:DUF1800 family protein [Verrucomicrobiales bacterium]